jgi:hypothetical protein
MVAPILAEKNWTKGLLANVIHVAQGHLRRLPHWRHVG